MPASWPTAKPEASHRLLFRLLLRPFLPPKLSETAAKQQQKGEFGAASLAEEGLFRLGRLYHLLALLVAQVRRHILGEERVGQALRGVTDHLPPVLLLALQEVAQAIGAAWEHLAF